MRRCGREIAETQITGRTTLISLRILRAMSLLPAFVGSTQEATVRKHFCNLLSSKKNASEDLMTVGFNRLAK